jgi:hypothetical protein
MTAPKQRHEEHGHNEQDTQERNPTWTMLATQYPPNMDPWQKDNHVQDLEKWQTKNPSVQVLPSYVPHNMPAKLADVTPPIQHHYKIGW